MSVRDVLILGNFRGASRSALTTATNSLRLNVVEFTGVDEAIAALESRPWQAVLVDTTLSGASRFCAEARAVRNLFDVPLIALSPRLTDLAFLNALRWGADDVVALGAAEPLAVRLASLFGNNSAAERPRLRGTAVVADPDRRRGDGLGRALHLAGYNVKYANDPVSARYYLAKSDTSLYVLNSELAEPTTLLGNGDQNPDCRFVVLAKPTQLGELEQQFHANRSVVVMSSGGPPENVLFAVNLLFPNEASKRGETRALFGTVVFFRAVGDYRDECGFSYTASPQGIYVRTLAPAPSDKVWVELIPPDGERRVRLVGRVAWSRPFGSPGGEAAPPGFGVRIVDGLGEDLSLWSTCLRSLEFRAPATLVPEARFSTPMSRLSSPDDLRPFLTGPVDRLTPPPPQAQPVVDVPPGSLAQHSQPTVDQSTVSQPTAGTIEAEVTVSATAPVITSATHGTSVAPKKTLDLPANLSNPPASLPLSRLRNPANQVSARPSLRLSVPGPANSRRDPLLRSGKLSRPPTDGTAPPEPIAIPSRPGQGQTVLGLGLLKRDGSVSDNQTRPAVPPPKQVETETSDEVSRGSLDPYIVSPVTGRTLTYGSDTPAPLTDRPTFPPNSWDDDTTRTNLIDDISDRPTLTDRLSSAHNSVPASSVGTRELEPFFRSDNSTERSSVAPVSPDTFESLPPEALESDAPAANVERPSQPLLRRDPVARTYFGEAPVTVAAQTDKNWVGLDRGAEDLFSAAERELESATHRASTPTSETLPGFASPAAPVVAVGGVRPAFYSGEIAPDTDPQAPFTSLEALQDDPENDSSPFEPAPLTPLPETKELSVVGATQTVTTLAPRPKRAVWFVIAAALCATLAVVLLVRRTQVRPPRAVNVVAVPDKAHAPALQGSANPPVSVPAAASFESVIVEPRSTLPTSTEGLASNAHVIGQTAVPAGSVSHATSAVASAAVAPASSTLLVTEEPAARPKPNATDTAPSPTATVAHSETTSEPIVHLASTPPKNPQDLPAKNAWLYVRSEAEARVFVHGIDSGTTNTWIETPCGTRFVRLGRSAGNWLGQGFATVIRCRNTNIVEGVAK